MLMASLARFLQYAGAVNVFGAALFFLLLLPSKGTASASSLGWPKRLLTWSGLVLVVGAVLSLIAQAATMNGVPLTKLDLPSVQSVLMDTRWGHAVALRIGLSVAALLVALVLKPGKTLWWAQGAIGTLILASFAWTGHGAATEGTGGTIHLVADIAHLIAAGIWLGALSVFLLLVLRRPSSDQAGYDTVLESALRRFSGLGSALVAVLVLSGLVNSYYLIGLDHLKDLLSSTWVLFLLGKLAIFALMLGLAAMNRFKLTPSFERAITANASPQAEIDHLKKSLLVETLAGLAVLALVAALGMMEPPAAQ